MIGDILNTKNNRSAKVASVLSRALSQLFSERGISEEMGLSILDVKVSQNMHNATVFVNLSGDALKKLKELNEYADVIKASIYKKVQLRYVPKILFRLDKDFEKSIKVHEILKSESDNISD